MTHQTLFRNPWLVRQKEPYLTKKKSRKAKPIAKIDENGNIIETYPSIKKAGEINHLDPHSIRDMLSHKYNYFNKVKFVYINEKSQED